MHRIRTWARTKAHGPSPLTSTPSRSTSRATVQRASSGRSRTTNGSAHPHLPHQNETLRLDNASDTSDLPNPSIMLRFALAVKDILFYSIMNVLLIFVPVGMVMHFTSAPAGVVFAMNAIAIVPLAGLLSHATESVASRMGDTVGALINVTFGNAVELIIFLIALVKDEIRIVQASLVGSILANLLLILGMCFFLGGLRFREQIYNSTVTQMSACLLSLSVTSLLLPTAFHASFSNTENANHMVLPVSRGTSVVLLLVYLLYLVFQLRSHSYMYESTPQDVIERESVPGPAAQYFNASLSTSSESSAGSDTDSSHTGHTAATIRRIMKRGKKSRRTSIASPTSHGPSSLSVSRTATPDLEHNPLRRITLVDTPEVMTPSDTTGSDPMEKALEMSSTRPKKSQLEDHDHTAARSNNFDEKAEATPAETTPESKRADFALSSTVESQTPAPATRPRPFSLRSIRPVTNAFTVFPINPVAIAASTAAADPSQQNSLRRARTMPGGWHNSASGALPPLISVHMSGNDRSTKNAAGSASGCHDEDIRQREPNPDGGADHHPPEDDEDPEAAEKPPHQTSMTTAILLLLASTGLVAVCAEFMVDSIDAIVATDDSESSTNNNNGAISEAFIGLILLPLVGNAAEHVTAVTVALKNKMDLAIGVALGSSIQIALFITPLVVLVGWVLDKDMSLFFTLFETICMFVSAFIVNFLVLDGRSNYLEGALLCSAYVIISVAAFFSPNSRAASQLGGGGDGR